MSQHVLIVGGSSGIGLATARTLDDLGFTVTIAGRTEATLKDAAASMRKPPKTLVLDASDAAEVSAALRTLRPLHHLVLALGSGAGGGPFTTVAMSAVRQAFDQKVFPHFATAQAAVPALEPGGSITFVAAVSAQAAIPGTAGLGAANAAISALVPILASELRPLRINAVSPGVIDTRWWDFLPTDQKRSLFADFAGKAPVGRVGTPDDVAHAIGFLVTNTFMTGHTLVCDGGLRWQG